MQEIVHVVDGIERTSREYFVGDSDEEVHGKMKKRFQEIEDHHHVVSMKRVKIGRNDPCPCGSGLKFKKCCIEDIMK